MQTNTPRTRALGAVDCSPDSVTVHDFQHGEDGLIPPPKGWRSLNDFRDYAVLTEVHNRDLSSEFEKEGTDTSVHYVVGHADPMVVHIHVEIVPDRPPL
jgi:hypothetical protein